jgi:hypothetical protein
LCVLSLFSACAMAQTEVSQYRPGVTPEGVTYYLPRTAIRVVLTAERTDVVPGEFCDYASIYLHLNNVPTAKATTWAIKDMKLMAFGVPDTSKIFSVKIKEKTVAPLVRLSESGLLLSINTEADDAPVEFVMPEAKTTNGKLPSRDYMNEDILAATSTAKMAELTASEIYDIRDSRNALTRGQADNLPKDGAQLKLMLDQLDRQNDALTQMFRGYENKTVQTFTFIIDPSTSVDKKILFRFSKKLGILDDDDLAGEPIYFSVKDEKTVPVAEANVSGDSKQPLFRKNLSKSEEKGIRYNVPSRALVQVYDGEKNYAEGEFSIAQFGNVEILSPNLFNKKYTTKVTFHSADGSINKVMGD